jgi:signal transduction histidine kinase/ligand-binding sensor domain-containing protein
MWLISRPASILFLLICVADISSGAAPQFISREWQSEDGLPSNALRTVVQAADGYLWVGTAEGLVRFDGERFSGFVEGQDERLSRLPVHSLFPLPNGEVWIGTGNVLLRGKGSHLEEVDLPAQSENGVIPIVSQVVLGEGGVVFAVQDNEVWQIESKKKPHLADRTPELDKLLQEDAIWGQQHGRSPPHGGQITFRDSKQRLWQFTPGSGLTVSSSDSQPEPVSLQGGPPAVITAMCEDREGSIWLATQAQGLWRLRPPRVEILAGAEGLSDREILLVREDRAGALWMAPSSGGLDCITEGIARHFEVGSVRRVSALLETKAGILWAARSEGTVYWWKNGSFRKAFQNDNLGPGKIVAIAEDQEGRIWFGGRPGLLVLDGSDSRRVINLGSPEFVTALTTVGSTVWVGTESGKIFSGDRDGFQLVAAPDALAAAPISDLLPDGNGSLWIGTLGAGLFHSQNNRIIPLAPRMSEVDPQITCVLDDGMGYLWLGTHGGICRVAKAQLLSPTANAVSALMLDRSDGLLTRECTRGGQPAGWRGADGTLYFSTGNGIACVQPAKLVVDAVPPPVVIEEADAGGRLLALGSNGGVQTGPGLSRLEFRFTALSFSAPEKVRFRVQLEGMDESWRDIGDQRTVAYEAVPPGRYQFRVTAENGDGVWNEEGTALAVEVLPHLWEMRWFQASAILLAGMLTLGTGTLVTRARMRGRLLRLEAQNAREAERARIARDMHDELGASLTRIAQMSDLAVVDDERAGAAQGRLAEIGRAARLVSSTLDQIVWTVNPRNDNAESLVEYLGEFALEFLEGTAIPLNLELPPEVPHFQVRSDARHQILLGMKEALNNAVKYAKPSEISVRITIEQSEICVVVADDGCGFEMAAVSPSSNGLQNIKQRFTALGGSAQIESCPGTGTVVTFCVRLE